jgi:hypothetical protein
MTYDERDSRFVGIQPVSHNKKHAKFCFKNFGGVRKKIQLQTLEIID